MTSKKIKSYFRCWYYCVAGFCVWSVLDSIPLPFQQEDPDWVNVWVYQKGNYLMKSYTYRPDYVLRLLQMVTPEGWVE